VGVPIVFSNVNIGAGKAVKLKVAESPDDPVIFRVYVPVVVAEAATLKESEICLQVPTVVSEQDGVVVVKEPPPAGTET
jgi:hypothetical protein